MSRFINADALRHRVLYFADARNLNGNHEQAKAYNHCLCMIDDEPTADVAEVVHGEWIPMGDADKDHNQLFECSNCGCGDLHAVEVKVPFCWKCGAKMDKGGDAK